MALTRGSVLAVVMLFALSSTALSQQEKVKGKKSTGKTKSTNQPAVPSRSPDAAVVFETNKRKVDNAQPPYFGHRRPVKIRPTGKRKLCRICGIVH